MKYELTETDRQNGLTKKWIYQKTVSENAKLVGNFY